MKVYTRLSLTAATILSFIIQAEAQIYQVLQGRDVWFETYNAKGSFENPSGSIRFNPNLPQKSFINLKLKTESIETGNRTKNKHARSEKWLHTLRFPEIGFKSTQFIKENNNWVVKGVLSLQGIEDSLTVPISFYNRNNNPHLKGEFAISRKHFGIMGNAFGFAVGDLVRIQFDLPLVLTAQ